MRIKWLFLLALGTPLMAQVSNPSIITVSIAPSGACTAGLPNQQVTTTGLQYSCQNGTWGTIGGGATSSFAVPSAGGSWTFPAALDPSGATDNSTAINGYITTQLSVGQGSGQSVYLPPGTFYAPTLSNLQGVPFLGPGTTLKSVSQASTNNAAANVYATKATRASYVYKIPRIWFGQEYIGHWMANVEGGTATKVIFTGDSTTSGTNLTGNYLPDQIFRLNANARGIYPTLVNSGVSGKDTADWLSTYLASDQAQNPDVYIIRWGFNDPFFGISATQTITNIRSGLATIRNTKSVDQETIILEVPSSANDNPNGRNSGYLEQLRNGFAQAAIDYQAVFVDLYADMPDLDYSVQNSMMDQPYAFSITSWSITGNVVTFQATNTYTAGMCATITGLVTGSYLNTTGLQPCLTVIATGLSGSQFEANFTHANASATEAGFANSTPPIHIHPGNNKSPLYNQLLSQILLDPLVGAVASPCYSIHDTNGLDDGFIGVISPQLLIGVNRNPCTGAILDSSKTTAAIYLGATANGVSSTIQSYVTNAANNPPFLVETLDSFGISTPAGFLTKSGNTLQLTADTGNITATSAATATTVFTFPTLRASTNYSVHCSGTTTQATAGAGIGISIATATTAATDMEFHALVNTSATAINGQSSGLLSTTTATAIYTGVTGTLTTQLPWTVDGSIEIGSTPPSSIIIGFFSISASDAVVVKRESYCTILP